MRIVHGGVLTFLDPGSAASSWKLEPPHLQETHVLAEAEGAALCLVAFGLQCQPSLTFFCLVASSHAAPQHSFSTWQAFMNSQVSHSRSLHITERVRRFTQQSSRHEDDVPRLDEKTTDERDVWRLWIGEHASLLHSFLGWNLRSGAAAASVGGSKRRKFGASALGASQNQIGRPVRCPSLHKSLPLHEMQVVTMTLMKRAGICIHMALQSGLLHANVFLASCLDSL